MWRSKRITIVAKSVFAGLFLAYFLQNLIFFDSLVSWLMFSFSLAIIVVLDNISPGNENEKIQFERNKTSKFIYLALFLLGAGTLFLVRYFAILPLKQNSEDYQFYNLPPDVRSSLYSNKNEISPFGRCSDYLINTAVVYEQNLNLLQQDNLEKNISLTRKEFVDKQVSDIDGQILEIKKSCQHERESYFEVHAILELYSLRQKIMGDLDYTVKEMERYGKEETLLSPRNPNTYAEYSNTLVLEGKYFEALKDCNFAIQFTELAVAYYYRGLAKVNLGDKMGGCLDMSKSGELGYQDAYIMIKKYCQ